MTTFKLKLRPWPIRVYRSYLGFRKLFGPFKSLRLAIEISRVKQL